MIIDQSEDKLDNQSVAKVFEIFIQAVKKRRQIILVIHNPHVAVVADSDLIIHVKLVKKLSEKEANPGNFVFSGFLWFKLSFVNYSRMRLQFFAHTIGRFL